MNSFFVPPFLRTLPFWSRASPAAESHGFEPWGQRHFLLRTPAGAAPNRFPVFSKAAELLSIKGVGAWDFRDGLFLRGEGFLGDRATDGL
jgi:hypothetical protein